MGRLTRLSGRVRSPDVPAALHSAMAFALAVFLCLFVFLAARAFRSRGGRAPGNMTNMFPVKRLRDVKLFMSKEDPEVSSMFFAIYLEMELKRKRVLPSLKKHDELCLKTMENAMNAIIPFELFCCLRNKLAFYKLVKIYLTASFTETIQEDILIKGWNVDKVVWLEKSVHKEITLRLVVKCLYKSYLKPRVFNYLFYCLKSLKNNEIIYYSKAYYKNFYRNNLYKLAKEKTIVPIADHCGTRSLEGPVARLRIYPKGQCAFRPIVSCMRNSTSKRTFFELNRLLYGFSLELNKLYGFHQKNFHEMWKKFTRTAKDRPIYGMKIDLEDAFGNVEIEEIPKMLRFCFDKIPHRLADETVRKYTGVILQVINSTKIIESVWRRKAKVWKWNKGLLQGQKLSGALCHLFRTFHDVLFLHDLIDGESCFYRNMDDYFYCSVSPNKIRAFHHKMLCLEKINGAKTQTNVRGFGGETNEIHFNGRVVNLETKEIECRHEYAANTNVRFKYKLETRRRPDDRFIRDLLKFSFITFHFHPELINLDYNSVHTVLANYFKGMIALAFKFDAGMNTKFGTRIPECAYGILASSIRYVVRKCLGYLRTPDGARRPYDYREDTINEVHLKVLALQAFTLVLKKRATVYKDIVYQLQEYRYVVQNGRNKISLLTPEFFKIPKCFDNLCLRRSQLLAGCKKAKKLAGH